MFIIFNPPFFVPSFSPLPGGWPIKIQIKSVELDSACGSMLQMCAGRLAYPANAIIAGFGNSLKPPLVFMQEIF